VRFPKLSSVSTDGERGALPHGEIKAKAVGFNVEFRGLSFQIQRPCVRQFVLFEILALTVVWYLRTPRLDSSPDSVSKATVAWADNTRFMSNGPAPSSIILNPIPELAVSGR